MSRTYATRDRFARTRSTPRACASRGRIVPVAHEERRTLAHHPGAAGAVCAYVPAPRPRLRLRCRARRGHRTPRQVPAGSWNARVYPALLGHAHTRHEFAPPRKYSRCTDYALGGFRSSALFAQQVLGAASRRRVMSPRPWPRSPLECCRWEPRWSGMEDGWVGRWSRGADMTPHPPSPRCSRGGGFFSP